jgi:hypothetical protein
MHLSEGFFTFQKIITLIKISVSLQSPYGLQEAYL